MKTKASDFDKKFDDGESVIADLDLSKARRPAEWDFHNTMLAVKEQVGKNSDQVQALGLKKKSEYKAPTRKVKAA